PAISRAAVGGFLRRRPLHLAVIGHAPCASLPGIAKPSTCAGGVTHRLQISTAFLASDVPKRMASSFAANIRSMNGAELLGVTRQSLSNLMKTKRGISPEMPV